MSPLLELAVKVNEALPDAGLLLETMEQNEFNAKYPVSDSLDVTLNHSCVYISWLNKLLYVDADDGVDKKGFQTTDEVFAKVMDILNSPPTEGEENAV